MVQETDKELEKSTVFSIFFGVLFANPRRVRPQALIKIFGLAQTLSTIFHFKN
jgi:hypothetical protein